MITIKTEVALDYAAHRLSCFDCTYNCMCDAAARLHGQVMGAQQDWAWFQDIAGAQEEWAWNQDIAEASEENPPTYTEHEGEDGSLVLRFAPPENGGGVGGGELVIPASMRTDRDQLLPGKLRHQGPGDVSGRIPD